MARTAIMGAIVVLLVAVLAMTGTAIGITSIWPVLLAVAVGLVAGHVTLGRVAAFIVGAVASWMAVALGAAALPQTGLAAAIAIVVGLGIITAIAAVSGDRVPLWAGIAGYAAFAALYEPIYAANPTLFLSESPVALLTVLLAGALGMAIAAVADLLTTGVGHSVGVSQPVTTTDAVVEGEAR
jgi:hypothetical protein